MAYGKVFESMFTGSMVGTSPLMFAVWSYCIAQSKPPGYVELNPTIIASILGSTRDEVQEVLDTLCAPDPMSRTPDEDGRKLVQEGHFLYRMTTWVKYNAIRNDEKRREQNRAAQSRHRGRTDADSQQCQQSNADTLLTDADVMLTDADSQQCQPTETESTDRDGDLPEPAVAVSRPTDAGQDDGFDVFWSAYQKKASRPNAETAWRRLSKKDRKAAMDRVPAYVAATPDKAFRMNAQGWLNQRRWEDEIITKKPAGLPVQTDFANQDYRQGGDQVRLL